MRRASRDFLAALRNPVRLAGALAVVLAVVVHRWATWTRPLTRDSETSGAFSLDGM